MLIANYNLKLFVVVFSLIIIFFLSGFVYFQRESEVKAAENFAQQKDLVLMGTVEDVVPQVLDTVFTDVKTMAQLPAFREYLVESSVDNVERVKQIFVTFSQNKKIYDQIRYLDNSGQEKIRVNYTSLGAEIVPEDKLQNKKGRYYFEEALALDEGQIYVSPLDLNVEQNKIEEPYKPMLRIATPVYLNGSKQGILIVNYLAQDLLNKLEEVGVGNNIEIGVINKEGYWFLGVEEDKLWGFMFDARKNETLSAANPELWSRMQSSDKGLILLAEGLYTYTKLQLVPITEQEWRLYLFDSKDKVYSAVSWDDNKQILFLVILLGVFFVINIIFFKVINKARSVREKQAEAESLYLNLYDNSTDAIMLLSPPDWNFISGNRATLKLFGFQSVEEFKKYTPEQLSPDKQNDGQDSKLKAKKMIEKAIQEGHCSFEWTHKTIKGEAFPALVNLGKIQVDGRVMVQAIVRDISLEKQANQIQQDQATKLRQALTEAERFNNLMVGREMEMIRLKKELAELRLTSQKEK